ncbi:MAG: hypothetical protein U0168_21635 [Nannocystaceae bacterium]
MESDLTAAGALAGGPAVGTAAAAGFLVVVVDDVVAAAGTGAIAGDDLALLVAARLPAAVAIGRARVGEALGQAGLAGLAGDRVDVQITARAHVLQLEQACGAQQLRRDQTDAHRACEQRDAATGRAAQARA